MSAPKINLPPQVALAVLADMRRFHAEKNQINRDAIAAEAVARVHPYWPRRGRQLNSLDMKKLFVEWSNQHG
jgi:hypothetical protein